MEAGTSTLNQPFTSGPSSASSGGPAPAMPEEQPQHKPFFYVQPPQPYLPMQSVQWPLPLAMPLNYSPYYGGYPGFGFGLPLMPHFQPTPFMDAPGFVVPHTHLHLMDYRRLLNPHYYQSMAYHTRRLRYQQNAPPRDVTSSEVQTEPLPEFEQTSKASLNKSETSKESPNRSTAVSVKNDDRTMALNELAPLSANTTPQKGSFVIETEEVRVHCCATPAGLQVLRSHETSEMSRQFAQDVVHCSSIVQNSLLPEENPQIVDTEDHSPQSHHACPDILIVATPSGNDQNFHMETTPTNRSRIKNARNVDAIHKEEELKVVHLPFDVNYLEQLRQIESTVWSTEDTLVPSPEFIIDSCDETLHAEIPSAEMLVTREEMPQEEVVPTVHMQKLIGEELANVVPILQKPLDNMVQKEIPKQASLDGKMERNCLRNLLLADDLPVDLDLRDHQDTSFESLPAYLPSSSWLADFENTSHCKMPLTPQKFNRQMGNRSFDVPTRRRKLDAEFKEVTAVRKPKERYKPMGKTDRKCLSDHECCTGRSYNENAFISYAAKSQRLCLRCSSKQRVYKTSTSPTHVSKSTFAPFQRRNDVILPTCEACKGHTTERFVRKGSSPDVRFETEGETSENGCRRKLSEEMKRPLAMKQNVERCPVMYSKLRERNCLCGELHQPQVQPKWQRIYHCPHGNAIREKDENRSATLSPEPCWSKEQLCLTHRWQTEKPWKTFPGHNIESLQNDLTRAQHMNLHKKSLSPSQGIHRKDTRC